MADDKQKLIDTCLKLIQEHNLFFITDLCAYLPFSHATFYNKGLDKIDTLKEALDKNKIDTKVRLLKKWEDSTNATLQMALMKLICSDEERKKLSMEYKEENHTGEIVITRRIINGSSKG
jgi:hypothetical protein